MTRSKQAIRVDVGDWVLLDDGNRARVTGVRDGDILELVHPEFHKHADSDERVVITVALTRPFRHPDTDITCHHQHYYVRPTDQVAMSDQQRKNYAE